MAQLTPETLINRENQIPELPPVNEEQQKAIDDFFRFMLEPDAKEMHLTGPAGVGKTFTLNKIMSEGMERYENACGLLGIEQTIFHIELTATTNKAADVLKIATNKPARTIHSYMGFKIREDYETGETKITISNNQEIKSNTLIIIDEASMIDYKLYELIMKYTHKCKFLYTGDHCQMAPVFENLSKIYNNKMYFAELKKPMRNASQPALMDLCQQWRETVETGVFKPILPVPGVIDYYDDNQMEQVINDIFVNNNNPDARIMCYSNARVKEYNQYIRDLRGLPAYFETDETLVNASAYQRGDIKMSVEEQIYIQNNPHIEKIQTVQGTEFDSYELLIKKPNGLPFTVYIPSYPDHFNSLIKHFANNKNWTGYFYLKQQFPDLRPKDASTVYKAQGSTYDTVIIDLDNISKCNHANQVARMMYVAVSRPKNKIILYGKLKDAYSGG